MTATEMEQQELDGSDMEPWELNQPDDRSIHHRLIAIVADLPAIGKDQRNEQQRFMYRGHDDVMNALNPLLAKHGVFVVPTVVERLVGERQTSRNATMYEVNLHVRYRFYGAAGDWVEASAWGEGTDMGDKSTNKAMTMAFKNVLAQVFALATAELSDADAGTPEETSRGQAAAAPRPQGRTRQQEFNPATHLLPTAINVQTEDDANALRMEQVRLAGKQAWPDIEAFVILHVFGKPYDELDGKERRQFYTRLANAIVRADDLAGPGDFPPPTLEQVQEAWAWAFDGVQIVLDPPEVPDAPQEGAQDDEDAPGEESVAEATETP
jgi:ERF superfamily